MTRLAVDTCVLVDALFHERLSGPSVLLLRVLESGAAKILSSSQTDAEIQAMAAVHGLDASLDRSAILPAVARLTRLLWSGERVEVTPTFRGCADPADDKFVDLALQGGADYLVTKDGHLHGLDNPPVRVVSPWQLLYRERPDLRPRRSRRSRR